MTACLWGVPHLGSYVLRGRGFLAYRESRVLQHSLKTRAAKLHRAVRVVTVFAFLREQNLPCLDAFNISSYDHVFPGCLPAGETFC